MHTTITHLLARLDRSLLERPVHVRLALLALMAGHHVLLLGPPGTAKSLLARALCRCIAGASYFEYLLSKFTHPDELFGPVSIPGLKEEDYRRLTEGYLPSAHVAFLDEIFKANSAILNNLLTLINERVFHHGKHRDTVPLLAIIGASNEPPDPQGGLGALYDRFLVRIAVPPLEAEDSFLQVCLGEIESIEVPEGERIDLATISRLRAHAARVGANATIRQTFVNIRAQLAEHGIEASDRRWRWAVDLLKMSAATCNRDQIAPVDLKLLEHCFGDPGSDDGVVRKVVCDQLSSLVEYSNYRAPMEAAWSQMSAPAQNRNSYATAKSERLAQLQVFDDHLAAASQTLDAELDCVRDQAEQCLWVPELPPELLAGFVGARRTLDRFARISTFYRNRLTEAGPSARLLKALRAAQGRHSSWSFDDSRIQPRALVWICDDANASDTWIPLDKDGASLFADRAQCIESECTAAQQWLNQASGLSAYAGPLDWRWLVHCVVLTDDLLYGLPRGEALSGVAAEVVQQAEARRVAHLERQRAAALSRFVRVDSRRSASAVQRLFEWVLGSHEFRLPSPPELRAPSATAEEDSPP